MESLPDIDVFVGNSTYIDFDVFKLWLQQLEAEVATSRFLKAKGLEKTTACRNQSMFYILDQYRNFGMIEPMLFNPNTLSNQLTYQLTSDSQTQLITKYYEFDETVIRDLLGKKLSKGTRRDLDEISSKTGVKLKSCQRQFDNCRRVFKVMEELSGNLVENIQTHFLLPNNLAWNYAAIVFLSSQRFECSKRKLMMLNLNDFVQCSKFLIESWTASTEETPCPDIELDRDFLHELRGVKVLISDQRVFDRHKQAVSAEIQKSTTESCSWCDSLFRQLSRGIVSIAANLYKTKEIRDYFIDLVERIIEPCKSAGWEKARLTLFLTSYFSTSESLPQLETCSASWMKYFHTTKHCLLQIYRL
uniref:Acidic fibroblast growth factor intracellular-binding protein-like n=1 Tax=Phallusia mammillata TaxID=59560 RepID=A0A6F9DDP6_9ASCI|nr:acidic fibroblast growth factor intracellular-binding protein-like [Phallusia mammillata]